jgi:hypothetical protein
MSEPTPKIYAAMNAVQSALSHTGIGKDRKNEQQKYQFRGIDDMYNALSGLLADHKVLPLPSYPTITREVREKKDGGNLFVTHVQGMFDFVSLEDGSKLTAGPFPGEAMDTADKSSNKAMSAAFKYALMQVFTIPTEGDNDADSTTHEVARQKPDRQVVDRLPQQGAERLRPAAEPVQKPAANKHPLLLQLEEALNRYGPKRPDFEKKTAEAMGVATIADIPADQLPMALVKVIEHQKAASAAKAAKGATPAKKPAGKKKPDLPPPDSDSGRDQQEPDDMGSDDDIPV